MIHRSDWIDCKKETPALYNNVDLQTARSTVVLVVYKDYYVEKASYWLDNQKNFLFWLFDDEHSDMINSNEISYWMPVPMPPLGWLKDDEL